MKGQNGADAKSLTEVIQDRVRNVFGPIFVFEGVGTATEVFAYLVPESFYLEQGKVRPENEAENENGADKLEYRDVVFDDKAQGSEGIGCTAQCLGDMKYVQRVFPWNRMVSNFPS